MRRRSAPRSRRRDRHMCCPRPRGRARRASTGIIGLLPLTSRARRARCWAGTLRASSPSASSTRPDARRVAVCEIMRRPAAPGKIMDPGSDRESARVSARRVIRGCRPSNRRCYASSQAGAFMADAFRVASSTADFQAWSPPRDGCRRRWTTTRARAVRRGRAGTRARALRRGGGLPRRFGQRSLLRATPVLSSSPQPGVRGIWFRTENPCVSTLHETEACAE